MLKKVNEKQNKRLSADEIPHVRIADAGFPAPFRSGLEYSSPARGTWNIVHTGMLIPEAHEIFVCAAGCLRGVVLTAAEMGTTDRFSTVAVRENNLLDGDMEDLVIEGVTDIINKLPKRPPAVLVYTSCVHHFTGVDLDMIYATLRSRFPDIDFTDCYMNPIMRKSGLTPDQLMRSRLYMLLHERKIDPQAVAIIGNDLPTDADSDLMTILKGAGLKIHEITSCKTYEEYQQMAESRVYVSYNPDAAPGGDMLSERLGGTHYALKFSFDYDEIDETFAGLADVLGIEPRSSEEIAALRAECERELEETKKLIGDTPVSIDYTFCPRPLGLAKLLLSHGINVTRIYADGIPGGDRAAFDSLQKEHPDLMIYPTVHPGMRFARTANVEAQGGADAFAGGDGSSCSGVKVIAIGQKAAAFEETDHFVNVVEGGGMTGYEAITRTCRLIREAFLEKKEMRELVQVKGLGCEVCIR
ncbi:MAG: nitrogenase [Mogibacterium sp.]|nr:nitrogenase [Mogibacterium sp.]